MHLVAVVSYSDTNDNFTYRHQSCISYCITYQGSESLTSFTGYSRDSGSVEREVERLKKNMNQVTAIPRMKNGD